MHATALIFVGVVLDDLVEHVLEKHFPGFLLANNLEFAGKLFDSIIFVFHLNELVQGFKLVIALVTAENWLPVVISFDDIPLDVIDRYLVLENGFDSSDYLALDLTRLSQELLEVYLAVFPVFHCIHPCYKLLYYIYVQL